MGKRSGILGKAADGVSWLLGKGVDMVGWGVQKLTNLLYDLAQAYGMTYLMLGKAGVIQQMISDGVEKIDNVLGRFTDGALKIGARDFSPFGNIFYWDRIFKSIKNTNQVLGIAGNFAKKIESSFVKALPAAFDIGATADELAQSYKSFIDEFGGNRMMDAEDMYRLTEYKKVFGDGMEQIASSYANIGIGIMRTSVGMQRLVKDSDKVGANASIVQKELKSNISYLDKLSFKNGVKGLQDMAKFSVQTKMSLQSALGFAEKIWEGSLEGAAEMSADLQLLGGQFATIGDPFELMFMSRNEPDRLQKRLYETLKSVTEFNKNLGEIQINALGMSQLRELSKITGISLEELSKTAKNAGREMQIRNLFSTQLQGAKDFEEIVAKVSQSAEFDKIKNAWIVKTASGNKSIAQLNRADIEGLSTMRQNVSDKDVFKDVIHTNEVMSETMQRLIDVFKIKFFDPAPYQEIDKYMKGFASNMETIFEGEAFKSLKQLWSGLSKSTVDNLFHTLNFISGNVGGVEGIFKGVEWIIDKVGFLIDTVTYAIGGILGFLQEGANFIGLNNLGDFIGGIKSWIEKKAANDSTQNSSDFFKNYDNYDENQRKRAQGINVEMTDAERKRLQDILNSPQMGGGVTRRVENGVIIYEGADFRREIPIMDITPDTPVINNTSQIPKNLLMPSADSSSLSKNIQTLEITGTIKLDSTAIQPLPLSNDNSNVVTKREFYTVINDMTSMLKGTDFKKRD